MSLPKELKNKLLSFQRNEITEHHIYRKLGEMGGANKELFSRLSREELNHYKIWRKYTGEDVAPDRWKIFKTLLFAKLFGVTFATKLMERGEEMAQSAYEELSPFIPEASSIRQEEEEHEAELLKNIDEERLKYVDSMVLGLNDALVELLGTLAGLTFALKYTRLIGLAGSVTGIAAALSMMSSEYLSKKAEKTSTSPIIAAVYTGIAYFITLLLLVLPFFLFSQWFVALGFSIVGSLVLLFAFTFFLSVVEDVPLSKRFLEMTAIGLSVAGLSFFIGYLLKALLNVEI